MLKKCFKFLFKLFLWFNIISIVWVLLYSMVPVPYTFTMLSRNFQNKEKIHYAWKSYEEISPNIPLALVASEDQKFPDHWGFDFEGIKTAMQKNKEGKVIRGGSTISQQVAKNVFLWQHKSYLRKGLEAYYTLLIEIFWSKKRILEVYMNVCETGINTFGVEEGSQRYFKHSASKATDAEAAQLAQVLPSPQKYAAGINTKTHRIMRQMRNLGKDYLKDFEGDEVKK